MHLRINVCIQTAGLAPGASAPLEEREQESTSQWQLPPSPQSQQRPGRVKGAQDTGEVSCLPQFGHMVPWFNKDFSRNNSHDLSASYLFPSNPALSHSNPQLLFLPYPRKKEKNYKTVAIHRCFKRQVPYP